jgi:hypothetical protein
MSTAVLLHPFHGSKINKRLSIILLLVAGGLVVLGGLVLVLLVVVVVGAMTNLYSMRCSAH